MRAEPNQKAQMISLHALWSPGWVGFKWRLRQEGLRGDIPPKSRGLKSKILVLMFPGEIFAPFSLPIKKKTIFSPRNQRKTFYCCNVTCKDIQIHSASKNILASVVFCGTEELFQCSKEKSKEFLGEVLLLIYFLILGSGLRTFTRSHIASPFKTFYFETGSC